MKLPARLLLSAIATLTCTELGLRIGARLRHRERGVQRDARLGWRMLPSVVKSGFQWGGAQPSRTNSHGWRDVERSFDKPSGVRRIVVLGDSFTFGVGVDAEARFTEVLERATSHVEVLNLGMNAVGTDQELICLETDGLRYHPDVVICAFYEGNDFSDVCYARNSFWPKPHFLLEQQALVEIPPAASWDVRLRMCGYTGELLYRLVQRWTPYRVVAPEWHERDVLPLVVALVARMDADARAAGARFALFVIRSSDDKGAADPLMSALEAAGITVIDGAAGLAQPAFRFPTDPHWNAEGHRAAAELLHGRLGTLGWL